MSPSTGFEAIGHSAPATAVGHTPHRLCICLGSMALRGQEAVQALLSTDAIPALLALLGTPAQVAYSSFQSLRL